MSQTAMNLRQSRIIDPVLTAVAQGYTNGQMVGKFLFPTVPVIARAGHIIKFGKQDFMLYNTKRAPGQSTKRVQFGYADGQYSLVDHSLEAGVPIEIQEEAQNVLGIDNTSQAVRGVQNIQALEVEYEQAAIARNAASYAASNKSAPAGTDLWSNPASDPMAQVEAAREAVRQKVGQRPKTGVISAQVFSALKTHPKVIDRIKYTGRDVPTVELLASLFELPNLYVGDAVYSPDGNALVDVWGADMVLGCTDIASAQDRGAPSYGYTYQLRNYPLVERGYYDENSKTWYYPVSDARQAQLTGPDAGFLFSGVL